MELHNKLYLTSDKTVLLDEHYRYKISVLEISTVIKKGTQITIINNLNSFCNELLFEPKLLIKIIGKTLSCKSGKDTTDNYYLQGLYSSDRIKEIVYSFIKNYLLCISCDKPEINLKYKNKKIKQLCRACGNNTYLTNIPDDLIHILRDNLTVSKN